MLEPAEKATFREPLTLLKSSSLVPVLTATLRSTDGCSAPNFSHYTTGRDAYAWTVVSECHVEDPTKNCHGGAER